MRYTIEPKDGYLKAEMLERETPEETAEFVSAIVEALPTAPAPRVRISTRQSRPAFKVEDWKSCRRSTSRSSGASAGWSSKLFRANRRP